MGETTSSSGVGTHEIFELLDKNKKLVVGWNTQHTLDSKYEKWRVKWCCDHRGVNTPLGFREGTRKYLLFAILHGYK